MIVGGGNMGAALLGGLLAADGADPASLAVVEALAARRDELAALFPGVAVSADVPACAAAVIAVKPGDVAGAVGAGRRRRGAADPVDRRRRVDRRARRPRPASGVAVVRAMPNTPALVGQGAAAIAGGSAATDDDLAWAEAILGAVGTVVRVDEHQLDAVTALTGSGPAYLFLVAEALIDAGVGAGLPRPLAEALTTQLLRRLGGPARRARRPGRAAGDGHVAGGHHGGRAARRSRTTPCAPRSPTRSAAAQQSRSAELGA